MNTGQMMLSIGAMLLLSTIMLRVNSNNMLNETLRDEAQFGVLATSLATSIIEEAISKSFDEHSDSNSVSSLAELTSVSKLGPESGETYLKHLTTLTISMVSLKLIHQCHLQHLKSPVQLVMYLHQIS